MATKTTTTKASTKRPAKAAAKTTAAKRPAATPAKRPARTPAAKTPAAKPAAKRTPAKASGGGVDLTAVTAAAKLVTKLRAQLDAAVIDRNTKMAAARAAGARVVDLVEATGFASAGAAQAAMKAAG